jgi:hypothetical protein
MLKNKFKKLKKKDRALWLSHGTCSYSRMYINAVANSVMLYLRHDFYNMIFKMEHKLYIASGSAPPPPPPPSEKILGAHLVVHVSIDLARFKPLLLLDTRLWSEQLVWIFRIVGYWPKCSVKCWYRNCVSYSTGRTEVKGVRVGGDGEDIWI